jgi:hypothetical protein
MKAVIKPILTLLLFFIGIEGSVYGYTWQPADKAGTKTHTIITVRKPPAEKISKFQSEKDFNYVEKAHTNDNLLQRILNWLWRHLGNKGVNGKFSSLPNLWDFLELIIIAAAITLFIYFILKSQGVGLFSKNSGNGLAFTETHEDISQMNFDELIAKAAGSAQYRQAVRYLYLKSLKQLSDLDLIKWKADKTNRDYTIELRSSPFSKLFSEITMLFDYAWYGNAAINENTFSRIKNAFEQFNRQASIRN